MLIQCKNCNQEYEITPEYAGQEFECAECKTQINVPADFFTAEHVSEPPPSPTPESTDTINTSDEASSKCPQCGAPLKPEAKICIECGHNLKLGMNVKTVAKAKKAGSFSLAIGIA